MKVRELYNQTVIRLQEKNIPESSLEAEFLLRFFLALNRVAFYLDERDLSRLQLAEFESLLVRRLAREPLAYIIGAQEFWSLPFEVSPDVLIPRPETELLIEKVLALVGNPATFTGKVLDLGCGSGIIAIVLALELPGAEIVTVDISDKALALAGRNVERHGVSKRVTLVNGDWFSPFNPSDKFDFIVANPPYVSGLVCENLQPELVFEPDLALFAGDDGMAAYRKIIPEARQYLKPGGFILFEIGADQDEAISKLFLTNPKLALIEIAKDHAGLPRIALAKAIDGASAQG
jgi:release factor glutamine methyltransferase